MASKRADDEANALGVSVISLPPIESVCASTPGPSVPHFHTTPVEALRNEFLRPVSPRRLQRFTRAMMEHSAAPIWLTWVWLQVLAVAVHPPCQAVAVQTVRTTIDDTHIFEVPLLVYAYCQSTMPPPSSVRPALAPSTS